MKKIFVLLLVFCMALGMTAFAENRVTLYVGGEKIESTVKPKIVDDRTMLPLRATFEAIGAKVYWDDATQTVTATKDDTTVNLTIGSNIMMVNGEEKELDIAAYTENGRTMVPVRACAEAFGLQVDWFEETNTVKIRKEVSVPIEEKIYNDTIFYTYDDFGSLVYKADSYGGWQKLSYDNNGNVILIETSANGEYSWQKKQYDQYGNETFNSFSNGYWQKIEYDENGNVIYIENINGYWEKREYDQYGNVIYIELADGWWSKHEYDSNGNHICVEDPDGWEKHEYDSNGNLVYSKHSNGWWMKFEYDHNGNINYAEGSGTSYKDNSGWLSFKYEYDHNGNEVYREGSTGYWHKCEYDHRGNLIYFSDSNGNTESYEYDQYGNKIYVDYSNGNYTKYNVIVR